MSSFPSPDPRWGRRGEWKWCSRLDFSSSGLLLRFVLWFFFPGCHSLVLFPAFKAKVAFLMRWSVGSDGTWGVLDGLFFFSYLSSASFYNMYLLSKN